MPAFTLDTRSAPFWAGAALTALWLAGSLWYVRPDLNTADGACRVTAFRSPATEQIHASWPLPESLRERCPAFRAEPAF